MPHNLIAIIGATASGKTTAAVEVAKQFNGEIISADSRQVYRGLDLGSGKDLHEYGDIPYHLIDIIEPTEAFDLFKYQQQFYSAFADLQKRNKLAIMCGGSSLYINSILSGYQLTPAPPDSTLHNELEQYSKQQLQSKLLALKPNQHNITDLEDPARLIRAIEIAIAEQQTGQPMIAAPNLTPLVIAITWPREVRRERIMLRLKQRFEEGMIDEVRSLHDKGVSWQQLEYFGLEYRFIAQHLQDQISYNDLVQKLHSAIVKFAKKQDTWLRKMEREGIKIHWIEGGPSQTKSVLQIITDYSNL